MPNQNLSEPDKQYDLRVTGPFKIGRSPLCNLTVSDSHVSKVHCSLKTSNQTELDLSVCPQVKVLITDHSSNGTWIVSEASNEKTRLQKEMPTQLNEGDLILLTRSTDTNHNVIAYKYLQSPFPRVMKSIYRPAEYLNQGTEDLHQSKKINVVICEETEKPIASVNEDHSESEAVVLNKTLTEECLHNDEPLTKKCMECGDLKHTGKGIEIHTQNFGGLNNHGNVGNTTTTYKPAHLDQSVSSLKQDDKKSPNLKRKSESGDDFVLMRKVRFKEQIEEHFEQPESYIGSPFKNGDECVENLNTQEEDKSSKDYTASDGIGKGSSSPFTNTICTSTHDNPIKKNRGKGEVKPWTNYSVAKKTLSPCNPSSYESPSELSTFMEVTEKHDSLCMNVEHRGSASGSEGLADDIKSEDNCVENLENHVEDIITGHRDSYIGFDIIGKGCTTPLTTSQQKSYTSDNGIQKIFAKDEVKPCATSSLAMKATSHCDQLPSESPSESGKEKHDSPCAVGIPILFSASSPTRPPGNEVDDILYGSCVQCGKRIPQVTISLHEAVCEGLSQEAKSQDRVSLSSLQLESCLRGDHVRIFDAGNAERKDDSGVQDDIECIEENEQLNETNGQTDNKSDNPDEKVSKVSEESGSETYSSFPHTCESKEDLGNCLWSKINDKRADTSCTSGNIEGNINIKETFSGSIEQNEQKGSLESGPVLVSLDRSQPTLEKEESKERCTFCAGLFPVAELVIHVSTCPNTSAMASTDSEDPDGVKEACPYCANFLDVLALVEHVDQCKNLSMIKAVEISREDCSQSSLSDPGSDCSSRSEDDSPMGDKELCPKCEREFSLLELLSHAVECLGAVRKTGSGLESLRTDTREHINSDDVLDRKRKSVINVRDCFNNEDKIIENHKSIEEKCDKKNSDSSVIIRPDNKDIDEDASKLSRGGDDEDRAYSDEVRLVKEDDDITHGDDVGGLIDDEHYIGRDGKDKAEDGDDTDDFARGHHDVRLGDDESSAYIEDECVSSEDPSGDGEHLLAMETSEDDADLDQFEICPKCRKLFHLSLLVEHAAKCSVVSLDVQTTGETKTEFSNSTTPSESPTAAPIVFSDCSVCGVRLPVHMMGIHYPRCKKRRASKKGSECSSQSPESDPADFPGHAGVRIDNLSCRVTVEDEKDEAHPGCKSGEWPSSIVTKVISSTGSSEREADKVEGISLKRTFSSLDSYHDCEEQCIYCFKMFAVSVLVEHVEACATLNKASSTEELEQCCYCLQTFPLSALINHAQNCDQKAISGSQEGSRDGVLSGSQSLTTELIERCMYCFKDFPVSKLIRHAQKCDGDMSGPRERFHGFLPSIHDLSAISSVAILNDTQRAALQYVITRSAKESKKVSSGLLARVQRLGYSENDLKRTLQWVRSAAPIIIHINLDKVLQFLVKDTHYRNQFETGTSGGSTDLKARRSWEDRIFNNHYKRSSPSERVKYGVLNIVGDPLGVRSCINYGDSFLQLKKVRLRTTFASMDTSGSGVKLSCCEHYENVMYAYSDPEITAIIDVATGKVPFRRSDCISHYKEVQIHGPVSLSENVECIVVNARHQADTRIGSLLDLFVERNKCNLIWMDPDDLTGLVPTPHGAFGHHLSAGSLSGSLGRRRSLGRTTTRKRRKR